MRSTSHSRLELIQHARATRAQTPAEIAVDAEIAAANRVQWMRHRLMQALVRKGWSRTKAIRFAYTNH